MKRLFLLTASALTLAGCGIVAPARMHLPAPLESAERLTFEGIGGGTHGRFRLGAWSGEFERSEQRIAIFDTLVQNYGHTRFMIAGPGISSTIEARCWTRERLIDLDTVEFKPEKMAYRCDFTADGRAIPARFELQEVRHGIGGALMRNERRGEVALAGEIVRIRSVHRLAGSPIEMANPIGYVFEQNGRPIGALELNGKAILFMPHDSTSDRSRVIAVAALALAVFWDPANSALD